MRVAGAAMVTLAVGATVANVQACALDNVPSMSLNGTVAAHNNKVPHNLNLYAPFYFKRSILDGREVSLSENRRECARSLTRAAMGHVARWQFGDRGTAYGWKVRHAYKHKGLYRITVSAYY